MPSSLSDIIDLLDEVPAGAWASASEVAVRIVARLAAGGPRVLDPSAFDDLLLDGLIAHAPALAALASMEPGRGRWVALGAIAREIDDDILRAAPLLEVVPDAARRRWVQRRLRDLIVEARRHPEGRIAAAVVAAVG